VSPGDSSYGSFWPPLPYMTMLLPTVRWCVCFGSAFARGFKAYHRLYGCRWELSMAYSKNY